MRDPMGLGALDDWATGKTEAILLFQQVIINTCNINPLLLTTSIAGKLFKSINN